MPAGVTWGQYISFTIAAMVSMFAGSQAVHIHFQPLVDLQNYINNELKNLPENLQEKIKKELKEEGILKNSEDRDIDDDYAIDCSSDGRSSKGS